VANELGLLGVFSNGSMLKSGISNTVGRQLAGMAVVGFVFVEPLMPFCIIVIRS